jgi:prepilin-type N-terminal cleavage/methylation domain-containing protein
VRREDGYTLIELLVTLFILSIVSVVTFDFLNQSTTATAKATSNAEAEKDAAVALRTLTADLRAAQSISACSPPYSASFDSCVTFEIHRAPNPTQACPKTKLTYGVVGTTIRHDRTDYNASCTATTSFSQKVLVGNFVSGSGPFLEYFKDGGGKLTAADVATSFANAASVKVNLYLNYPGSGSTPLRFSSATALRNNR